MNVYKSIDELPIYNWFKCIENKDYSFVSKDKKQLTDRQLNECKEAFGLIYAEYIDTFGVSKHLENILSIQNEILILKIDKVLLGDKTLQMFIDIKELELKDLVSEKKESVNKTKVLIEKYLGFRINEKEVTVKEYYEYLEVLKENGRTTD